MPTIFWRTTDGKTVTLDENRFRTEDAFEDYILKNKELIGDVFILGSQVKTPTKVERPDIVGIDNDGNVVIVEIKNTEIDEKIIPQVLSYAIWAETNPDSIKALWFESKEKPEDIQIPWDDMKVRIMIAAPKIKSTILKHINKISYDVDLLEINRFTKNHNELILLNQLEPERDQKYKTTKTEGTYDREFYEKYRNIKSVDLFYKTISRVDSILSQNNIRLEKKFNANYVGYKSGFFNVFGINWIGSKSFAIFFKIPKEDLIDIEGLEPLRYEPQWSQILYKVDREDYPIEKLLPLIKLSYKMIVGSEI